MENLLIDDKLNLKFIDFDHVGLFQGETIDGKDITPSGSNGYLSPEQVQGRGYYGYKADLWQLGVIIFTLKFGVLPF